MDAIQQERLRQGIAALRSGEFEQAQGALRLKQSLEGAPEYKYCCLGVLTEMAVRNGFTYSPDLCACGKDYDEFHRQDILDVLEQEGADADVTLEHGDICSKPEDVWGFSTGILSTPVRKWYGFPDLPLGGGDDPVIGNVDDAVLSASEANDDREWNFAQIADAFESTFITAAGTENDARTAV